MKRLIKVWILIILGSIVWSATMVKSGLPRDYGIAFWGPNGHDGIWHLALSRSLQRGSLENPVFSGEVLKNYHIGFDLLIAFVSKLSNVSTSIWYFQIFPPLFALLIGVLTFKFVYNWTKSAKASFWSLFFVYFGGSVGSIIHLIRYGRWGGDSMFWAQSSATTLINPPFALSLVLILWGLNLFQSYLKKNKFSKLLLLILLFAVLIQVKAYAGILLIASLFLIGVLRFIRERKLDLMVLFFSVLCLSLILFLPLNKFSSGLIIFYPFWFLETLMSFGERIFWEKYYQAMTNYKTGGNYPKAFLAYGVSFLIFLLGNLGSRMLGATWIIEKLRKIKTIDYLSLILICIISTGMIIPMFFVQKGTPWNTIQFFYYSLFFAGIVSGIAVGNLLDKIDGITKISLIKYQGIKYGFISLILLLTIPTTITTMGHYLPPTPPAKISKEELSALEFLENQPDGVVLSLFLESEKRFLFDGVSAPRPLYLYDSTAYVSAYSNKQTYFSDEVNLNIMGYNWPERKDMVKSFQENPLSEKGKQILKSISPDYIYYIKNIGLKGLDENYLEIENIYDNNEVIVYKVLN